MVDAGREMDALVAERVMGLTVVATDWPCGYDPECGHYEASHFLPAASWHDELGPVVATRPDGWPPRELVRHDPPFDIEPTHGAIVEPVPFYSADLADAWCVVEKLRVDHYVEVSTMDGGWWVLFAANSEESSASASGDTVAEAICRAALAAVGVAS